MSCFAANCRGRRHRSGVVALEFAAIAPVLLTMVLGTWDTARALIAWQETLYACETVAFAAQSLAVQKDLTTDLTPADAALAMSTLYGTMPQIKAGQFNGLYSVALSAVRFQTQQDGAVIASLLWSVPLKEGTGSLATALRKCGRVTQVDTWPQTDANLQVVATKGVALRATVAVADVHYRYTPLFFSFITGTIDFWESYQLPNLSGAADQLLTYDKANYPNDPAVCPGVVE